LITDNDLGEFMEGNSRMIKKKISLYISVVACLLFLSCSETENLQVKIVNIEVGHLMILHESMPSLSSWGRLNLGKQYFRNWPSVLHGNGLSVENLKEERYIDSTVTLLIEIEKNTRTQGIEDFYLYLIIVDSNGDNSSQTYVRVFRNDEIVNINSSNLIFTSRVAENGVFTKGKPMFFVPAWELEFPIEINTYFYLVALPHWRNFGMRIRIPSI